MTCLTKVDILSGVDSPNGEVPCRKPCVCSALQQSGFRFFHTRAFIAPCAYFLVGLLMAASDIYDDDYEDDFDEGYDEDSWSDDDVDMVECPACHTMIYEDSVQCPHCHEYVSHSTSAWSGRPWWWYVLAVSGVVALVFALVL